MVRPAGASEVAEALGVSRQRLAKYRERGDFPDPIATLAVGEIWDLDQIDSWVGSGVRRGPGRPRDADRVRVLGDRFELEEPPMGSGGFGNVFRALDRKTGETVAVKVLKNTENIDTEAITRFERELRYMLEKLDHPHVMSVIAHGDLSCAEEMWYVMPLASASLAAEIAGMENDEAAVLDLARQLCAGLTYVHTSNVLHRDLKPGNVLKTADGLWALSDFGLARECERTSEALTSTLRQGIGTELYSSPEQMASPKDADERDDIYSLAKILQHAITGELPRVPAEQMPDGPLRPVIALATGPRRYRYKTVQEFLEKLEQAVDLFDPHYEAPVDRARRLRPRVMGPELDPTALDELLRWMQRDVLDENHDELGLACTTLMGCDRGALRHIWSTNPDGFRIAFRRFAKWAGDAVDFDFEDCDPVAGFAVRAFEVTHDVDVLRNLVSAMAQLGADHNRWYVRDVTVPVLQGLRDHDRALVALEALQRARPQQVRWLITDFAVRSMHPVLREGLRPIIGNSAA